MHGGFLLFNTAYFRRSRAFMQEAGKVVQRSRRTDRINLHAPIVFVPHPTPQTERVGVCLDKPAEANALHATEHIPAARYGWRLRQCFDSAAPSVSIIASTSDRNDLTVKGLVIRRKPLSTTYRCTTWRSS